ncbi:MAG: hypothetical protein HYY09_07875 [Firmicutes bacterium]|nr:hypothetical protein [Bacillota bacterium]
MTGQTQTHLDSHPVGIEMVRLKLTPPFFVKYPGVCTVVAALLGEMGWEGEHR